MKFFIGMILLGLMMGCSQKSLPSEVEESISSCVETRAPARKSVEGDKWHEEGQIPDAANMKSKEGFGAQLFLTEDEDFFSDWNRPNPPGIAPVEEARRGVPVFTVVILAGLGTDSSGLSNVTYDLVVRKPDGSIYSNEQGLVGWNRKYRGFPQDLQLAEGYMGIVIEESDPDGTYTVEATVHDHIKNVTLVLETKFYIGG